MARPSSSLALLVIILCFSCLSNLTCSDLASDRQECTQQLIGLSTCLNYIEGKAKTPPPDCCDGLKTVLQKSRKCLCILVNDRNDPGLGFKIDPNLALSLPSTCNAPANISECPTLLHLAPSSPDAQIFNDFVNRTGNSGSSTTKGSSSGTPSSSGESKSSAMSIIKGSGGKWLAVELATGGVWIWCLFSVVFFGA
ncbi:putative GPI-anchored protein [Acorus calamus]|uniref:GPI-anchored protein n=1 Tax=Acorus calamus TaxID=4465 RepID=A0AAV9E064_ACOCL|nr:putative GPI-anchored protein [Acorus calamus]